MRYDTRRGEPELFAQMPRRKDGGIQVCRQCQRSAFFAGGFLSLLARDLEQIGRFGERYK